MGATLCCSARDPHCGGLPRHGARAPCTRASVVVARGLQSAGSAVWRTGLAAPRHVGSSRTRARTRVPCTGRQTPNHCATREARDFFFYNIFFFLILFIIYLFIYLFIFGCVGSSVRARAFPGYGKRGPLFIAVRGPLFIAVRGPLTIAAPPVAGHRLQTRRLSSCGPRAQPLRGMWDPPRPGLEPASPAPAGRLSTTAPPGKPWITTFIRYLFILPVFPYAIHVHVLILLFLIQKGAHYTL